jgi:hypothetical protein
MVYCLLLPCLSGELIAAIGDTPVLQGYYFSCFLATTSHPYLRSAFHMKIRLDIANSNTDSDLLQKQNKLIHEMADVLRRNIVQGRKSQDNNGEPLYRKFFFFCGG